LQHAQLMLAVQTHQQGWGLQLLLRLLLPAA
jgi:hypothetical protein